MAPNPSPLLGPSTSITSHVRARDEATVQPASDPTADASLRYALLEQLLEVIAPRAQVGRQRAHLPIDLGQAVAATAPSEHSRPGELRAAPGGWLATSASTRVTSGLAAGTAIIAMDQRLAWVGGRRNRRPFGEGRHSGLPCRPSPSTRARRVEPLVRKVTACTQPCSNRLREYVQRHQSSSVASPTQAVPSRPVASHRHAGGPRGASTQRLGAAFRATPGPEGSCRRPAITRGCPGVASELSARPVGSTPIDPTCERWTRSPFGDGRQACLPDRPHVAACFHLLHLRRAIGKDRQVLIQMFWGEGFDFDPHLPCSDSHTPSVLWNWPHPLADRL